MQGICFMYKIRMMSKSIPLILLGMIVLLILPSMAFATSPQSTPMQSAIVIGTRVKHFEPRANYTFGTNTELNFEAPEIDGWIFSYMKVDLGCRVGGVVGTNVTKVFSIDGGYILECVTG